MSDKAFERSLTGLTVLVIAWIVCSIIVVGLHPVWAVISGLVVEIGLGGYMLHRWGKSYMERTGGM